MKSKYYLLLGLFFLLSLLISIPYRNFIYDNALFDFGLADVGYNIFAVTVISLISWIGFFSLTKSKYVDILLITLIYLSLEGLSYFFPLLGTFDFKDLLALIFSGFLTLGLLFVLNKNSALRFSRTEKQ